jgi:hypothetical protein
MASTGDRGGTSGRQRGETPLQKTALRLLPGELDCPPIGGSGLDVSSQTATKVCARRMDQVILEELAAAEDRIDQRKPAAGPSRIATATARLSSMTGEGSMRSSAS